MTTKEHRGQAKSATGSWEQVAKYKRRHVMKDTKAVMTSRQAAELDHAFERNGFTSELVKKLSEGNTLGMVCEVLLGRAEIVAKAANFIAQTFKMVVNYDLSIKELVKGYDWKNDDITNQNFLSTERGEKKVEFALFHFKKTMTSEEVIAEMEKSSYRPATMKELLSFGNKNPELQREFPIIALGSVAKLRSVRFVGCLYESGGERNAGLDYYDDDWSDDDRFLGVRK